MLLFCDTETTGLPHLKKDPSEPDQPDIIQLALLLCEDNGKERASFSTIVRTEMPIHPAASAVHGVTNEDCDRLGMMPDLAYDIFDTWAKVAEGNFIAHNTPFDSFLLRTMQWRYQIEPDPFPVTNFICTMELSKNICKLPPTTKQVRAGFTGYKNPKLSEALEIICEKELVDAHDALADVRACRDVYFKLKEMGAV